MALVNIVPARVNRMATGSSVTAPSTMRQLRSDGSSATAG